MPSRVYDVLKWLGLIVLPALAVFVNTVGPAWGWPHVDAIVITLNALGILAGALIGVSAIKQRLDRAA
ncbi:phage holin [Bifidobacterium longum]|nr:phage holin [Bifidobacterium longum]MDG5953512.1 phage holin [Bifidobacterium longum]